MSRVPRHELGPLRRHLAAPHQGVFTRSSLSRFQCGTIVGFWINRRT